MADKGRDAELREMAGARGFRLVKSRRRKPGGDHGRYGLAVEATGEQCLGFGSDGLTATAEEIEAFLRRRTASTWKQSLGEAGTAPPDKAGKARRKPKPAAAPRKREAEPKRPAPKLRVRDADSVDSEALAALVSGEFAADSAALAERLAALARGGEPPLVARLGDELVGVLAWHVTPVLHRPAPVGRITFLEVAEKHRRAGIGKALVEAAEVRLAQRGCRLVEVTSNVRLAKAHKFYRALGFERTSHRFARTL